MTRIGLLKPMSKATDKVVAQITDQEWLTKARVHPFSVLLALKTYSSGQSYNVNASKTWTPVQSIVDALDEAYYLAFGNIKPTGKNFMLGLDVSGSMGAPLSGSPITCYEAAAAMAMVTARVEKNSFFGAFTSGDMGYRYRRHGSQSATDVTGFEAVKITAKQRLDDVVNYMRTLNFGGTDCSLPMRYALANGLDNIDTFIIYTDNETWAGPEAPVQSLNKYRAKYNPDARLITVGMTSSGFTIADPADSGMLDVVGFDGNTPNVISAFSEGVL